ncbi:MAG: hypothetical protein RIT43_903 [Bacteroidota bacterium]|jgi:formylglycine-generating enzyme required for sulfatase activity
MVKIYSLVLCLLFAVCVSFFSDKAPSLKKALTNSYVLIPSGNVIIGGDTVSVQAFYILEKEVTNKDYQEFLQDLKRRGENEKLHIALVDSAKWNVLNGSNEAYAKYYHTHEAYKEYPVVNVSYDAAILYCKWLGEKYDEKYGTKGGFLFRLMEKEEYLRACRGESNATYAWGTNSLHNSKGQPMCNFSRLSAEHIHLNSVKKNYEIKVEKANSSANTGLDVLAPSKSYFPNAFKVYNLNGNAAEMIVQKGIAMGGSWQEPGYDVRVESERVYEGPNPLTGFRVVITSVENWEGKNHR